MFFKGINQRAKIKKYKRQIAMIEKKRIRSQAALIEAILQHKTPSDTDVDYFNQYTTQIDYFRDKIHALQSKE